MTQQPINQTQGGPMQVAQEQINQAVSQPSQPQPNLSFTQQSAPNICPNCGNLVLPNFKFCPNCGKVLDGKFGISIGKQVYIYIMSVILPPTGLYWGIKYLLNPNPKVKIIGAVSGILTIVSLVVTFQIGFTFFQQFQKEIGMYQNLSTGNFPTGNPAQPQLLK